jgi:exodeoxyribonuclease V alpha subunit
MWNKPMTTHMSARLVWHDNSWNGCVCQDPLANTSCLVHDYIREGREDNIEKANACKPFKQIKDYEPPCSGDMSLLSPEPSTILHSDPLDWCKLPDFTEDLEPYSFCTRPYGRMRSNEKGVIWENNSVTQLKNLDEYYDAIVPEESLVFFYANQGNPLVEDAGDRLLIGVARIVKKGPQLYFPKTSRYNEDYPIWSRAITIDYPQQTVMIPYQEYIKNGFDTSNIICKVPSGLREKFSYVSEQLTDDEAVIALEAIIQTVRTIQAESKSNEDWDSRIKWLNSVLSEVWGNRGAYPGIGSVLEYLGMHKGTIYQFDVLNDISSKGKDALKHTLSILCGKRLAEKNYKKDIEAAISQWQDLPDTRRKLLTKLCLFELTKEQVERVTNSDLRKEAGITASVQEILDNPYLLTEQDLGGKESSPISFEQIDHGMLPLPDVAKSWGERVSISQNDKRRTRALIVEILKVAAKSGDTLLTMSDALSKVRKKTANERNCNPDQELIKENSGFFQQSIDFNPELDNPYLALPHLRKMEIEVSNLIAELINSRPGSTCKINWQALLEKELGKPGTTHLDKETETRAQKEKSEALEKLFGNRFSVLTGRAGTGKTTVVKILLQGIAETEPASDILLLAPTGKARVRLRSISKTEALTIHQFLNRQHWINKETFTLLEAGGNQYGASTIIIDEASMIPLDLLGTLFRAIKPNTISRLILIGDSNQLPPIGPGRPFVDIINWLDQETNRKSHLVYLKERARQLKQSEASEALSLSDGYIADHPTPNDDAILSDISNGFNKGDLEVHFWETPEKLLEILNNRLAELLGVDSSEKSYVSFNASLGIPSSEDCDPENWQILSPVRMQRFGTKEINRLIQKKYRFGLMERSRHDYSSARPFGDENIVYTDKVIQIANSTRNAWFNNSLEDGYVANGEVGFVCNTTKGKHRPNDYFDVRFSTQADHRYRYYRPQTGENIELAYAITVHKAQGSDFKTVFLIIPQKAGTLSRELLYTGLTRFKKKLVLLIEKDITPLKLYRKMNQSETLLRNTNLFEIIIRPEGIRQPYPEKLIHRTTTGELVRSKSEVIVANVLTNLGLDYKYEEPLEVAPHNFRLPDFTIHYKGQVYYWEHLGMLNVESYRNDWNQKEQWYKDNNLFSKLITSQDGPDGSIDSALIKKTAMDNILSKA